MKLNCEIIRDLLPLYSDKVCSEESKAAVEEHLKECEPCREELKAIDDNKPASLLKLDSEALIIGKYRRILLKKLLFFAVCAVILPSLTEAIADLNGDNQNMIFIITAVSLLFYVYIPAVVQKKRDLWITVSSVIAPVVIILYTGLLRDVWNFIDNYKECGNIVFLGLTLSAVSVLLYVAMAVIMFFVNRKKEILKPFQYRSTAFKIMIIITVILYYHSYMNPLTSMSTGGIEDFYFSIICITFILVYLWLGFTVFIFCKSNIFIKLGLYSVILGFFVSTWDTFIHFVRFIKYDKFIKYINPYEDYSFMDINDIEAFWKADFFHPTTHNSSSNTYLAILLISLITAGIFICIGIARNRKSKKQKNT